MTYPLNTYANARTGGPDPDTIFGPYSAWPRKRIARPSPTTLTTIGAAGVVAVFVHCVVPLIA